MPLRLLVYSRLRGIVEYEPDEFTVHRPGRHARRGAHRQRWPSAGSICLSIRCSPTRARPSAASVAAGQWARAAFALAVCAISFWACVRRWRGRLLRVGGKVVKNAAGFDFPKFFVGSLGRFGVLAEVTFKVFPRPAARLPFPCASMLPLHCLRSSWKSRVLVGNRKPWIPHPAAVFVFAWPDPLKAFQP